MNWVADMWISRDDSGVFHVECKTEGSSKEAALAGAQFVKEKLCDGKLSYMRAMPEAASEKDFDTKATTHRGYVRFSFKDEPGECHVGDPHVLPGVAIGELKEASNG